MHCHLYYSHLALKVGSNDQMSNVTEPGHYLTIPNLDPLGFDFLESHVVPLVPRTTDCL